MEVDSPAPSPLPTGPIPAATALPAARGEDAAFLQAAAPLAPPPVPALPGAAQGAAGLPPPPPPPLPAVTRARIEVSVRVRPENSYELSQSRHRNIIDVQDNVIFIDPDPESRPLPGSKKRKRSDYVFDKVYGSEATQHDVFEGTVKGIIPTIFSGYNSSVFCYGATGAGKTHTMMGDETSMPGVIPLAIAEVFKQAAAEQQTRQVHVSLSYCEIYNETIRDLLADKPKPLDFRVGEKGGQVAGLTWWDPVDAQQVLRLIAAGNLRRVKAETNVNEASSRSHAILQIVVRTKPLGAEIDSVSQEGKLSLIDLAGSERAAATENRGLRLKEGANINKSLLALGNVINTLASKRRSAFVGYRDSKLTRMLQDSLGGNCRTIMIANVSPSFLTYEDTHNTLKYANRAKSIQVRLKKNTTVISAHVSRYKAIIESLQSQVSSLQDQLVVQSQARRNAEEAEQRRQAEASDEAKVLERRLSVVRETQLCLHERIASHEAQRNTSLLKLRSQHSEILRWKHTASGDGGQEPVRIVTLKAEIVTLKAEVAMADCELQKAKEDYQEAIKQMADITAALPLLSPADQKHLGSLVREHQIRMDKAETESYVQYHKSRELHWEQRHHELDQTWAEMTMRLADTIKRQGTLQEVRDVLSVGKKWKALSDAVDASSADTLLDEVDVDGGMDVDTDLESMSPQQYPERHSFGLGINYLERPKRPTTSTRPDDSASQQSRSKAARPNVTQVPPRRRETPCRETPSYMKATTSSVRLFKKERKDERGEERAPKSTTPRMPPPVSGSSPSFLKPTLSAVARHKRHHSAHADMVAAEPAADLRPPAAGSERTNLLDERRRQRKLAQAAEAVSSFASPPKAHPASTPSLKHPMGVSASQALRGRKRSLGTTVEDYNTEPFKRGRLSDEFVNL